jgi:hypothetical protein
MYLPTVNAGFWFYYGESQNHSFRRLPSSLYLLEWLTGVTWVEKNLNCRRASAHQLQQLGDVRRDPPRLIDGDTSSVAIRTCAGLACTVARRSAQIEPFAAFDRTMNLSPVALQLHDLCCR